MPNWMRVNVLLACSMLPTLTCAQNTEPGNSGTSSPPALNASVLKKVVGFLRVGFLRDGSSYVAEGTCFFVFYEDKRLGDNGGFIYLVTNRHVAVPGIED